MIHKLYLLISGFTRRLYLLRRIRTWDFIFIHREAAPIGFPIIEWIIVKIFQKKVIYDFDDSIWLADSNKESAIKSFFKYRSKVGLICSWSYKISCGNHYLTQYASRFNQKSFFNPTTIDVINTHNPNIFIKERTDKITLGWTGSHSTNQYLEVIEPVLIDLIKGNVNLLLISDKPLGHRIPSSMFIPWNASTEINDLQKFDVGLMPLPDDEWVKGKCGLKALQYMAMEIPVVLSPFGANVDIVEHGVEGFFANDLSEWKHYISKLIQDQELREKMGKAGRKKVINNYSLESNARNFLALFE